MPKGVAIEHRNAVNFVCWAQRVFTREELAGVLFSTSLCFDLSVFELFVTLCSGGKVIIAQNALELPSLLAKNEVTLIGVSEQRQGHEGNRPLTPMVRFSTFVQIVDMAQVA